jgi:hypothetical protein
MRVERDDGQGGMGRAVVAGALFALAVAVCACSSGGRGGGGGAYVPGGRDVAPPAERLLLEERCTGCHPLVRVDAARLDAAGWASVIDRMVDAGARLDADERRRLIDYLVNR